MANMILADTDVLIDFFFGNQPVADGVQSLLEEEKLAVSVVTVFELYAGVEGAKRLNQIELFLGSVMVVPMEKEVAVKAGSLYTTLKKRGKLIGNQDILIASTALHHSWPIFTRNLKHFGQVDGIKFYGGFQ